MIKKINYIKNFGIYTNYADDRNIDEFKQYNLFYGWNGSGKSTLARLFRILEKKDNITNHDQVKFKIEMDDGSIVTEESLNEFNKNVFVYNEDFIKDNIDWDGTVNSILLLSKDKIEETKEFNNIKHQLYGDKSTNTKGLVDKLNNLRNEKETQENKLEKSLSDIAKNMKNKFIDLGLKSSYHLNYDKTKLKKVIKDNGDILFSDRQYLNHDEELELRKKILPEEKNALKDITIKIDKNEIEKLLNDINKALKTTVTANVIDRLKQNSEISSWVEGGLKLHKEMDTKTCEFCGGEISEVRINELDHHFNDEMNLLKNTISSLKSKVANNILDIRYLNLDYNSFFPEYKDSVLDLNRQLEVQVDEINKEYESFISILDKKNNNPFEIIEIEIESVISKIILFNDIIDKFKTVIDNHNNKIKNREEIINECIKKIEINSAKEFLSQIQYIDKVKEVYTISQKIEVDSMQVKLLSDKVKQLEATLSNEVLAADEFNKKLEQFIGYNEIELRFNQDKKGYEIIRVHENNHAKDLSEGERTAISFVYFMTKIKENGNKIEDLILIIDDPISSFDSNKLFNGYAYLKMECDKAKQLFIMTHNFNYFKLIRGWIQKKNITVDKKKTPKYKIYKIEPENIENKRHGMICNAGITLNQTSQYDYVFYQVYKYYKNGVAPNEIYICGNASRKLVESFLSFKFPSQRSNLENLLGQAFKDEPSITKDRIYRFINMYSHSATISVDDELDEDNLISESSTIIKEIINMIERLDPTHYKSMKEWAEKEIVA